MKKNQIFKFLFLIVLAMFLAACGAQDSDDGQETEDNADTEVQEQEEGAEEEEAAEEEATEDENVERELLTLTYEVASYDSENDALVVSVDTNLPTETEIYRAILRDADGNNALTEYEVTLSEEGEVLFSLQGVDKAGLAGNEYELVFEFNVTEKTNSNLATDKSLGGTFSEMNDAYQDSEQVEVKDLGSEDTYAVVLVSSETAVVPEDLFGDGEEEEE